MAFRKDVPVLRLELGSHNICHALNFYGFTAEEIGMPLVEITGPGVQFNLTIEQAQKFAEGMAAAIRRARGEVMPTVLDEFMKRRGAS